MISIIVITYNRLKLLKLCVDKVLLKTSDATKEIIIWNNASTDGTNDFLSTIKDPRFKIIHHTRNIGVNAWARVLKLAAYEYLILLDDDVIDAPNKWDKALLDAFRRLPQTGFLATNIIDDGKSTAANYMFREAKIHLKETITINGIDVIEGCGGAWCAMTSKKLHDELGGFRTNPHFIYWHADSDYRERLKQRGYDNYLLKDLKVFHAAGPYYANDENIQRAKRNFYRYLLKRKKLSKWKTVTKKILNKISFIRRLNSNYQFYHLPNDDK